MSTKKPWFNIRKLGWTPCSWQGWAVLIMYIVLMYATLNIPDATPRRLYGGTLTATLLMTAMIKTQPRSSQNK